ncbi:MAG: polysaccharide biosynthesis/export family protein [Muribaculaceae bacterium]|nr:polysaccharide biosynthesis/export family protein [Muribaculaceae bacterium]
MKIKSILIPALALCAMAVSSCSSNKTVLPYFVDIIEQQAGTLEPMNYMPVIAPDDELRISVTSSDPSASQIFNTPEINPATRQTLTMTSSPRTMTYVVNTAGDIDFPQLGAVHVAGLTIEQVKSLLTERISRWVTDPIVNVAMVGFNVTVAGEVRQPAKINVTKNRFTILEALSEAGDLTEFGERSNILIIREEDGQRKYAHLNLNDSEVLNSEYYYLQPNDYVYVAPNKVRQENSKYNQNNGFKLSIISTVVSAASVIASLVIALTVK